jgi:hypothetical protein
MQNPIIFQLEVVHLIAAGEVISLIHWQQWCVNPGKMRDRMRSPREQGFRFDTDTLQVSDNDGMAIRFNSSCDTTLSTSKITSAEDLSNQ